MVTTKRLPITRRLAWRVGALLPLLLAMFLTASWAQTPPSRLPWRLGPGPGTKVSVPVVETVQGDVIETGVPSLVFFTMVDGSEMAYEFTALVTAWQRRHPGVQVIVVDTRSDPEAVREWVARRDVAVPVVADEDDAFEEAFDTNRLPILYLLDDQGVIQDKITGGSLERFIEFDQVLGWAEAGEWEKVAEQRSEWLTLGEVPAKQLPGVPLVQGNPTVVYHTDPFCPPCQQMVEGLQAELNGLAERYPDVRIVVLEGDIATRLDLQLLEDLLETYTKLYGREAAPGEALLAVERGLVPEVEDVALALPKEGWAPNVELITYLPGDANDPQRWWGQATTPGLMIFDAAGAYQGPAPLWLGPFDARTLASTVAELLGDP